MEIWLQDALSSPIPSFALNLAAWHREALSLVLDTESSPAPDPAYDGSLENVFPPCFQLPMNVLSFK